MVGQIGPIGSIPSYHRPGHREIDCFGRRTENKIPGPADSTGTIGFP